MVEIIIGQAGSGKTTLMFERIASGKAEQYIIVPEQYSYEFDKTLYEYLGAERFNKLFSLSFTSLARQLFQIYGDPGRKGEYADEMSRMILIYMAIDKARSSPDSLKCFSRRSSHSGFAEEMLELISDLRRSGTDPEELLARAQLLEKRLADKAADTALIYAEYERLMKEHGYKDELDNVREAAKLAALHRCFEGTEIYIDEFESFNGDQLDMLRIMISSADNITITLRTDDVTAGEFTLFETVNDTYRRITDICRESGKEYRITDCGSGKRFRYPELGYLSGRILRNLRPEPASAPSPEHIRIFEARDMYAEAEYVCATIKRLVCNESGLKYKDIAVISNDINAYAEVFRAAFDRYDIPYFLSTERSVAHTPIMVYINALLDILNSRRFRSEHIFRLLKCGLTEADISDISLLENYCYKWGIDGDMWLSPFTAEDPQLKKIEQLRSTVAMPLYELKKRVSRKGTDAQKICAFLYEHLVKSKAERCVSVLMDKLIRTDRDYDASELKRLWSCLIDILDSISETLTGSDADFAEVSRIMRSMIGRITYSVPPQTLDSVIAASSRNARLNAPKVIFAVGSCEGDFPNNVSLHGLFSEADKQKLAEEGIEIARPVSDLIAAERLIVYKSLSTASERLYLTYPLSDLSGQAKYPSRIIDSIISMFGREDIRLTEDDLPPHYYAVTLHAAYYHYMQQRSSPSASVASIKKLLMEDNEYKRRIAYVLTRTGNKQDYHIDSDIMQQLKSFTPLRLSSTDLENYDLCHFKYFCSSCLKLKELERIDIDARIAGDLTHECFRGILGSHTKKEFISMSYDDIRQEINNCARKYCDDKLAGEFGKTAKFGLILDKLKTRMAGVFLHTQQSLMASDFVPDKYELNLRDEHSVILPFGGGYDLSFGGIVDRADVCRIDGKDYVRIIDYKSSRKEITAETLAGGINLQMLLYLFASTDEGGIYESYQPAGVLYSPLQVSEVSLEAHRVDSMNSTAVNSALKTSGLVLGENSVINAMDKNGKGVYIPVKMSSDGVPDKRSSCITSEGMKLLKEYTYRTLTDMAGSLLSGDAEAVPMMIGKSDPCSYCSYINICDNSLRTRYRLPEAGRMEEAEAILAMKYDRKEEN